MGNYVIYVGRLPLFTRLQRNSANIGKTTISELLSNFVDGRVRRRLKRDAKIFGVWCVEKVEYFWG